MMSSREGQFGSSSTGGASGFAHSPSPEAHDSAVTRMGEEVKRAAKTTKTKKKNDFISRHLN